jgi:competence ComEA-like helix-hairpin-helix protein
MIKNFFNKIGFSETEAKVILFLIIVLFFGAGAKYIFKNSANYELKNFDYSSEDSLFASIDKEPSTYNEQAEKPDIDYKNEVPDFNKQGFVQNIPKQEPVEKRINLNSAELKDLLTLPGIGEKTARNIINYRQTRGSFKNLNELLQIKGIGKTKYNKIIKYLYIDN